MPNFQREKQVVLDYYHALDTAEINDIPRVLSNAVTANYLWRGFHPFNEMTDPVAVAEQFWMMFRTSVTSVQRRMDIFFAGQNSLDDDGAVWVVSMGHLMGLFDLPWMGAQPTRKMAFLRYAEFNRIEGDKIAETAFYFDIPHFLRQSGLQLFPTQTAAHMIQPGPLMHDGLLFDEQPVSEGAKTLAAIDYMVGDIKTWSGGKDEPLVDELRRSWNEDMYWYGPEGIGATYTIERYAEQHSGPFRAGFKDRTFNGHICRTSEGSFGGFFGWPNLTLTPVGGFMGMPDAGTPGDMRVIDIYKRVGDKLTENWIFIDLLHFWKMQGHDYLADLAQ